LYAASGDTASDNTCSFHYDRPGVKRYARPCRNDWRSDNKVALSHGASEVEDEPGDIAEGHFAKAK
jgi:hypothetical protein